MTGLEAQRSTRLRKVWWIEFAFLGALAVALYWYPIHRISIYSDVTYNEGWNAYRAQMAAQGERLYAAPPRFTITNYPPLSFHLIGFLGRLSGNIQGAGRWVSLLSLAMIALLTTMLVRQFTGRWALGVYAMLVFGLGLAVFLPDRIGMNDPQLLGLACSLAGLYFYARYPASSSLLFASAIAFAISLFVKHNLLAFPCAVGMHLLLRRAWKHLAVWSATLAAVSTALLLLTFMWDGPYFFSHLLAPRAYSFRFGWLLSIVPYLLTFQIAVAGAALWSCLNVSMPARGLLAIAFVLAHVFGFGLAGGDGVVQNILFDALIVVAIITAIGLGDLEAAASNLAATKFVLLFLLTIPFLGILLAAPLRLNNNVNASKIQPKLDAEFAQGVEFLKRRPGPALCEDLLMCYDAGKPHFYDPFFANDQMKIGRLKEAEVAEILGSQYFSTIQIAIRADQPLAPGARDRFSDALMNVILEHYRPIVRASEFALLVPKDAKNEVGR